MTTIYLRLTAKDPIVARDGRPFGAGQGARMRSLTWPLPSVVAGTVRTILGKNSTNHGFAPDQLTKLLTVQVSGLFPLKEEIYLPSPLDCVWENDKSKIHCISPVEKTRGGCDFPVEGLLPVMLTTDQASSEFKSQPTPDWWPLSQMVKWLVEPTSLKEFNDTFLLQPTQENRDHVKIDPNKGAADEGFLYSTTSLNMGSLPRFKVTNGQAEKLNSRVDIEMATRVVCDETDWEGGLDFGLWHPLGGERRLVHWDKNEDDQKLWKCPEPVSNALKGAKRVRMILATPAVYEQGWRPGWLDEKSLKGRPTKDGPLLKLVGVVNSRWKALSGWSLAEVAGKPKGPKPIQRMVPAGSVYFFEIVEQGDISGQWLQPTSDTNANQKDGFGLAIWGIW